MESMFAQQHPKGDLRASLIALRIHTLSAEASILFSQGRWLDLSWLFHSFLFTWSCCPNNHCFGEHFAGSLNVFSDVLGGFVWLCLARVEQSYPNMVKLGKGLPWNPALCWGFSAWTGNVSHSLISERKCEYYSLPIVWDQTVLLLLSTNNWIIIILYVNKLLALTSFPETKTYALIY